MKRLSEMSIEEMIAASDDGLNLFIEELPEGTDLSSKNNGASGKDEAPEKENKMDKREVIREIMAIAAKPVSEFAGGEEERERTIAKLVEKIAYNPSETGANDACAADGGEDKRKLIDEIGGILNGKVDEEIIRTVIAKAEKLAYNASERSADDADINGAKKTDGADPLKDGKKADLKEGEEEKTATAKPALSMDELEKTIMKRIAKRDALAAKVKPFIGTFDSAEMTSKEVAVYACEKLGLKVAADSAEEYLNGYLAGKNAPSASIVMDEGVNAHRAEKDAAFEAYLKQEAK